jgi:hypothetical protein
LTLKEICAHVGNEIMLLAENGIIVVTLNTQCKKWEGQLIGRK